MAARTGQQNWLRPPAENAKRPKPETTREEYGGEDRDVLQGAPHHGRPRLIGMNGRLVDCRPVRAHPRKRERSKSDRRNAAQSLTASVMSEVIGFITAVAATRKGRGSGWRHKEESLATPSS